MLSKRSQAFADAVVNCFLTRHITTIFRINGPYHWVGSKTAEHLAFGAENGLFFSE
jgi:hypothetical protein